MCIKKWKILKKKKNYQNCRSHREVKLNIIEPREHSTSFSLEKFSRNEETSDILGHNIFTALICLNRNFP